jgi:hypothetical protein
VKTLTAYVPYPCPKSILWTLCSLGSSRCLGVSPRTGDLKVLIALAEG